MDLSEIKNKPVFISGHPKAGTGLLLNLLDSHSQLVVFPEESMFFRDVLPLLQAAPKEQWFEIAEKRLIEFFHWSSEAPVESQTGFESHDYSFIAYDQVHEALRSIWSQVESAADVLSAAVLAFGMTAGQLSEKTRWWVEMTPLTEYHAEEIFRLWPDARVLHIVRDPRDNFAAYERKHIDWTEQYFARKWRRSTQVGLANRKRYGEAHYLIIKYEDLAENNQEILERICAFLEIDFTEALLRPSKIGRDRDEAIMFDQESEQAGGSIGIWKTLLSSHEVGVIEAIAAKQMKACGYQLTRSGGWEAILHGLYWRIRQNFYFSRGLDREEKGLNQR